LETDWRFGETYQLLYLQTEAKQKTSNMVASCGDRLEFLSTS
jgi:hypothetical protein